MYRGRAVPALIGAYLYGDYCSGEIFAVRTGSGRTGGWRTVAPQDQCVYLLFGEDDTGEIYVLDHKGAVYQLVP